MAQLDLFPDLKIKRTKASKNYGVFTDKFKTKLTTDDCYTPEPVYNAVRDWCVEHYGLQGREIVRPFWPGADFEMYDYPENCVVIDNPPFSIYDHILDFYTNTRPSGGRPSGGKANDRSGAGREGKSDFKTIKQKHLTQGETT